MLDREVVRETVKGVLITFANLNQQLDYHLAQPSLSIPGELYCQWFDDVYHPQVDAWRSISTEEELRSFDRFSQLLRRHEHQLVSSWPEWELAGPEWTEVRESAQEVINIMAVGN